MLLNLEQIPYFNKVTLGSVLGYSGENLNYWIKKLLKEEQIISLKNGFYVSGLYLLSMKKNPSLKEKYLEYLANMIRYPSYISMEYALAKYGVIPEGVYTVTSVTLKTTRSYTNKIGTFVYNSIKSELFNGFNQVEFEGKRIKFATKAKALFDYLYLKKPEFYDDLRLNLDLFKDGDKAEFNSLVAKFGSVSFKKVAKLIIW